MFAKILLAGFSAILLVSCNSSSSPSTSSTKGSAYTIEQRQSAVESLDSRMVQATNQFGLQLHEQLVHASQGENVFISPLSISLALAMTYNGSAGETQEEISRALGWDGMSLEEVNEANRTLIQLLVKAGENIQFDIANSLWARQGKSFHEEFLKVNREFYGAETAELDFNDPKSVKQINQWVSKHTQNKITKIVDEPLSENLVMLLINAIYFKGGWTKDFSEKATRDERFHLQDGSSKQVKMMSQYGGFEYLERPEYQAIRLPYGKGQMSMLVVVPNEASSLEALHKQIWSDPAHFQQSFAQSKGTIELPRFTIEYESTVNSALEALGMKLAFAPGLADFSRMANTPPELYISEVKHKTFLEVNEKGTEAAAVTSIGVEATSAPANPFLMQVDRPFFVAIEDRQTGAWLFVGSITNPQ